MAGEVMRWDGLFADLEAQAEALERAERAGEVDDRTRGALARSQWRDRARASLGAQVRIELAGQLSVSGTLARVGPDWLLLDEGNGREVVAVSAAVIGLRGLGRFVAVDGTDGVVESRLGLRYALRGLARDRAIVRIHRVDGSALDATIDRVGADFLEAATHSPGEVRRRQDVREVELVPLTAVAAVRRMS